MEHYMEGLVPFVNTILLVIIFIFQKNKSNQLAKELETQKNLLRDTQDLLKQQAQVVESHTDK